MILNFLKITLRNLRKNKLYGFINISGLAVGLLACFLIATYLQFESGFDKFLTDADRIYQVTVSASFGGEAFQATNSPPPVGATLLETFPEIDSYTRIFRLGDLVLGKADLHFTERDAWAVDSNFLAIFDFPLIDGDPQTCLNDAHSIVLTQATAQKYFGDQPAFGKKIEVGERTFRVKGVLRNLPKQSSLQFDMLLPVAAFPTVKQFSWSWVWLQMETFVRTKRPLAKNERLALEAKFPPMVRKNAASAFRRIGQNIDDFFANGNHWKLGLLPMTDVHLRSGQFQSAISNRSDIRDILIFGTVGLFILLLACINFMNLSTAQAVSRAKEVGVRKVLGSGRRALIGQFIGETLVLSLLATAIALLFMQLALPLFNRLVRQEFEMADLLGPWTIAVVLGLPVLTGLLAGSYPAFFLSGFRPAAVLKNTFSSVKGGHAGLRSGLVVLQFAVSVGLITSTFVVLKQLDYMLTADLGIGRDNVLVVSNVQRLGKQAESFRDELLKLPGVTKATLTTDLPATGYFGDFYVPDPDKNNPGLAKDLSLGSYLVDDNFVPAMDISILEGRNFNEALGTDSMSVILNEAAVRAVGWAEPIGQWLTYPGGNGQRFQVIGIMRDFHPFNFRNPITPFALFHESSKSYSLGRQYLAAHIQNGTEKQLINDADRVWQQFSAGLPFDYSFLDDDFNAAYYTEKRLGSVLSAFALLSVFIAGLGLFGLIAFMTQQKTKEIGIRKVLGASVTSIVALLSANFLKLVLLAIVLAAPVAYLLMHNWLADFAYRIDMPWWVLVAAGTVAVLVAFLTVGFQSVRAALANPVESLRSE
ncbi:MAG: ABC transporter permease [Saprospiraceae bacterium]